MRLTLSSRKIAAVLAVIIVSLTAGSIATQYSKYTLGHDFLFGLVPMLDLNEEQSLPTWYASITLIFCALLLAIIAAHQKKENALYVAHWKILSAVFVFMSSDEVVGFHERLMELIKHSIKTRGIFYYAWVIPALILTVVFLIAYLPFLAHLPKKIRIGFMVAGAIYVSGVLGMEMIGGYYASHHGEENFTYAMLSNFEEFLEMAGIAVFILMLISYIRDFLNLKEFPVTFLFARR